MKSLALFFSDFTAGKKILILLAPAIATLTSIKALILALWFLIFIDLLTGIRKSLHEKNISFNIFKAIFWKSVKSYLLLKTWVKWYEYSLGIITLIVLESLVLGETYIEIMDKTFTISEVSVVIPACIEVWSIFENFEAVSGNNILKRLKKYLASKIKNSNDTDTEEY